MFAFVDEYVFSAFLAVGHLSNSLPGLCWGLTLLVYVYIFINLFLSEAIFSSNTYLSGISWIGSILLSLLSSFKMLWSVMLLLWLWVEYNLLSWSYSEPLLKYLFGPDWLAYLISKTENELSLAFGPCASSSFALEDNILS